MPFTKNPYGFLNRRFGDDEEIGEPGANMHGCMVHVEDVRGKPEFMVYIILGLCLLASVGVGIYFQTRESVTVSADFFEKLPSGEVASVTTDAHEIVKNSETQTSRPPSSTESKSSSDSRVRVSKKGVLGIVSGQIKGKRVAGSEAFGKGGFASDIDAIISGVGAVKSTGVSEAGRRGVSGIGYGAGYSAGFGENACRAPRFCLMSTPSSESAPGMNTEQYDHMQENRFRQAASSPLSTFSIDVDVASYSNTRRYLTNGTLPPADAVRIEEMINYFSYAYECPRSEDPFSVTTEVASCPWKNENKLVLVGIQGRRMDTENIPPSNLVFLIDVSGSMGAPNKLSLVKRSMRLLTNELRETDRVSIVVYAGAAGLVLPSTPGSDKERIVQALDKLESGGSTAGGEGIRLAYSTARENLIRDGNNRVILATDGDFNVGVSSDGELVRLIEQERESGVYLTVLGYGMGNYKDSKMEKLADRGNGNYAYIDNLSEARKVLVEQMGGTLFTIAKDVKIQVEFNPAIVSQYRLIGYENRIMAKEDFNDDKKDAGELGAGHSVTALYEIVPARSSETEPDVDELKYQKTDILSSAYANNEMMTVKLRYKKPDQDKSRLLTHVVRSGSGGRFMSDNLGFASAVAGFGMLLRESPHKGTMDVNQVLSLARRHLGNDPSGYRSEFVNLVQKYSGIAGRS